jgi:hypothetical protein
MDDSIYNALALFSKLEGETAMQTMLSTTQSPQWNNKDSPRNTSSQTPLRQEKLPSSQISRENFPRKFPAKIPRENFPPNVLQAEAHHPYARAIDDDGTTLTGSLQHADAGERTGLESGETTIRRMAAHIVIALDDERIDWVGEACRYDIFMRFDVDVHWFIYTKSQTRDPDVLKRELDATWSENNCTFTNVYIRRLDNVGGKSHTYVSHMFLSSFGYGDANIFLQGNCRAGMHQVKCGLEYIHKHLYLKNKSQETDKNVKNDEITKHTIAEMQFVERHTGPECIDPNITNLHFLPFTDVFNGRAGTSRKKNRVLDEYRALLSRSDNLLETENMPRGFAVRFMKEYFVMSEFVVSGALLRRCMQLHMNVLWRILRDTSARSESDTEPAMGFLWYRVFVEQMP